MTVSTRQELINAGLLKTTTASILGFRSESVKVANQKSSAIEARRHEMHKDSPKPKTTQRRYK